MKEWLARWHQLSVREQWIAIVGGVLLFLILYYVAIYSPLVDATLKYQQQIENNTQLLGWMKQAKADIALGAIDNGQKITSASILVQAENSIKQYQLQVAQIKQIQKNQVQLKFEAVPFEKLLPWFNALPSKYQLAIYKANFRRTEEPGVITATIVVTG